MLAWSRLIALVLTMIERRRLLLSGLVIEPRQCIEPIAGAGLQPRPPRPRRALHQARHAMRRQLGLVAHPLPHLLQPLPAAPEIRPQPALLLDRPVHLPSRRARVRPFACPLLARTSVVWGKMVSVPENP